MLTAKQHELLRFIQRKLEETGISPSFEEMKEALDLKSKSGVHRLISALEDRGDIRLGPPRAMALEVSGDSMIEAGILDGDYALVRRTNTARDGEIVVALVRNEEATLKYLHRENGRVRLDPANAAYDPQYFLPDEVEVQGKLAGLLRRYH
jgi:SOS-response transcriptional repressor LexA